MQIPELTYNTITHTRKHTLTDRPTQIYFLFTFSNVTSAKFVALCFNWHHINTKAKTKASTGVWPLSIRTSSEEWKETGERLICLTWYIFVIDLTESKCFHPMSNLFCIPSSAPPNADQITKDVSTQRTVPFREMLIICRSDLTLCFIVCIENFCAKYVNLFQIIEEPFISLILSLKKLFSLENWKVVFNLLAIN